MLAKLVFNSVARSVSTWLALIISAIVMSVILTLNIGLVIAGTKCETEEAQNAFVAMGSGALMFTVLTGFMSLVLVVKICVGLQRKQVLCGRLTDGSYGILDCLSLKSCCGR